MFYFCSVKTAVAVATPEIGLWCNGNTTDSGPVIPSSNLGSPTRKDRPKCSDGLFSFADFRFWPCDMIAVIRGRRPAQL